MWNPGLLSELQLEWTAKGVGRLWPVSKMSCNIHTISNFLLTSFFLISYVVRITVFSVLWGAPKSLINGLILVVFIDVKVIERGTLHGLKTFGWCQCKYTKQITCSVSFCVFYVQLTRLAVSVVAITLVLVVPVNFFTSCNKVESYRYYDRLMWLMWLICSMSDCIFLLVTNKVGIYHCHSNLL